MKDQLEQRLVELKAEYENGQKMLTEMNNTLMRISGAILVLEEELAKVDKPAAPEKTDDEQATLPKQTAR